MLRWLTGRGANATEVTKMQARIAPALWHEVCASLPFLAALDSTELSALHARSAWLLASKTLNGAHGLALTDTMRLSIAAQASLPILNLSPRLYEGWDEIMRHQVQTGWAILYDPVRCRSRALESLCRVLDWSGTLHGRRCSKRLQRMCCCFLPNRGKPGTHHKLAIRMSTLTRTHASHFLARLMTRLSVCLNLLRV